MFVGEAWLDRRFAVDLGGGGLHEGGIGEARVGLLMEGCTVLQVDILIWLSVGLCVCSDR